MKTKAEKSKAKTFWDARVVRTIRGVTVSFYKRYKGSCYTMDFKLHKQRVRSQTETTVMVDAELVAEKRIREMQEGSNGVAAIRSAKAALPLVLREVAEQYREAGPPEREENLRALQLVVELTHGGEFDAVRVDSLHPDDWDVFVWCYQEYERRGWTSRGTPKPDNAWVQIRREIPKHARPDKECITKGNTTILSMAAKARSVLGPDSRDDYLKPLRERFPREAVRAWWETKIRVKKPDGRFNLSRDVYEAMWQRLPVLKQDDPQVWALIRLHWTTGMRPVESQAARVGWLEVDATGAVLIVIKNRLDEGYRMKDSTTLQERPWPLPADLVEMLPRLVSAQGALLGCDTPGQWDKIYRRASEWLRACGVQGTQTLYNLRKLVATVKVANEGVDAARAALGHAAGSNVTLNDYAGTSGAITALSDAALSPEAVMGLRRRPFVLQAAA